MLILAIQNTRKALSIFITYTQKNRNILLAHKYLQKKPSLIILKFVRFEILSYVF